MRMNIAFDTPAYVKRLVAAGVPEAQAEVQAEALSEIALANLATKDDVRALKDDLRASVERVLGKIEALEERMNAKLESELRKQMLWFFAAQVALFGALTALFKLL